MRLGCLFVLAPLIELALLVQVGQWIGVLPTVGIVAATGLLGAWLARSQGLRTLTELQLRTARGELPAQALMDGVAILVGGIVLLTPGIVSDLLGFALLLPPSRRWLQRWARKRIEEGIRRGAVNVTFMGLSGGMPGGMPGGVPGAGFPARGGAQAPGDDGDDDLPPRPGEIIQKP